MPRKILVLLFFGLLLTSIGAIHKLSASTDAVRPFVKGSLAELTQERMGTPYVLAFWSMYCAPCIEEMDTWKDLQAQRSDFKIVMVSTDPIEKAEKLRYILDYRGLSDVEVWAFADKMSARVRYDIDPRWRGELPRIHFVDAQGNHDVVIGKVDAERVNLWLDAQKGR